MLTFQTITTVRPFLFGITGLCCLAYGVLAIALGRPDPLPFWLPGVLGTVSGILMGLVGVFANRKNAQIAWDEVYQFESRRATNIAFWFAVLLYPVFGIALALNLVSFEVSFAAMGTLTAAVYLLLHTSLDVRGRM